MKIEFETYKEGEDNLPIVYAIWEHRFEHPEGVFLRGLFRKKDRAENTRVALINESKRRTKLLMPYFSIEKTIVDHLYAGWSFSSITGNNLVELKNIAVRDPKFYDRLDKLEGYERGHYD